MTPDYLNATLKHHGLTQYAFADLLGVSRKQVNAWARGRAAIPKLLQVLLVAMRHGLLGPDDLKLIG